MLLSESFSPLRLLVSLCSPRAQAPHKFCSGFSFKRSTPTHNGGANLKQHSNHWSTHFFQVFLFQAEHYSLITVLEIKVHLDEAFDASARHLSYLHKGETPLTTYQGCCFHLSLEMGSGSILYGVYRYR